MHTLSEEPVAGEGSHGRLDDAHRTKEPPRPRISHDPPLRTVASDLEGGAKAVQSNQTMSPFVAAATVLSVNAAAGEHRLVVMRWNGRR